MRSKFNLVGNLLIGLSLVSLFLVYYPLLIEEAKFRLGPKSSLTPNDPGFSLIIPRLGINQAVTANVDSQNPQAYQPVLEKTLAHAQHSSLPGEEGSVFIFGHSSDNPFSITRYNTSFYLLDHLKPGDEIQVYFQNQAYTYQVTHKQTVKPHQAEALTSSDNNLLILQTCTPPGTSLNRLLIFAQPLTQS